jgi:hypothetical protein
VSAEPPGGDDVDAPEQLAPNDMGPTDPPVDEPHEPEPIAGSDGHKPAEGEPGIDDTAPAGTGVGDTGDALAPRSCTFAMPGEDVLYQTTTSFSGDDDLAYALPTDGAGEAGIFVSLLDLPGSAEVVDLEAMQRVLSEPPGEGNTALEDFGFILTRAPNFGPADANDGPSAYLECEGPVTQDNPGPDEILHDALTTFHDTDV